ncbi:MAG: MarR family transcriptional regulator [Saprospiraceae bacterium]|nr:MarR family transcriptional regulator [Saprospiraceae bacterium]HRD81080.1 MarR family transcriptional regulator [Saprospiraceae bacterium]HRF40698.1 MarR family transcriptional regulator [Saprospiraceae bacterium]HRJ14187.1 MarR family transcriptional regulator [Saprospiraceae bacterium]HRK79980.1 MarR family transcriptional regulator [Saprospiraceae bacterium]
MKIQDEIRQKKFKSEYQKAHINILFTAAWLSQQTVQILKPLGISSQQFNILRILRGMHPEPSSVKLLTERMIDKMSNASRLVDKLEAKKLVQRIESGADRRRVDVFITPAGLQLIETASIAVEDRLHKDMELLSEEEAFRLNELLDKMRG